jgi:acetyltransferase-like isoleucine patch superfamily enzyme
MAFASITDLLAGIRQAVRRAGTERRMRERFPNVIFGEGVLVFGLDRFFPAGTAFLDHRVYLNCAGGDWNANAGYIRLGHNCEIGPYAVLWGAGGITVGNNVHIGAHVTIAAHEARHILPTTTDHATPLDIRFKPVVIEDHTLICSAAVLTPGVRIGHHSMIGAGAVVVDDIPPYSLAVGCPAKVVRTRLPDAVAN